MKKTAIILLAALLITVLMSCSVPNGKELSTWDRMRECPVALVESSNGAGVYVWNMEDIGSLLSFSLEQAPLEPADQAEDWLYRITYNPKDKVSNGDEIVASFHKEYLQIGSEYYLPRQGVEYKVILEWAEAKYEYLCTGHSTK